MAARRDSRLFNQTEPRDCRPEPARPPEPSQLDEPQAQLAELARCVLAACSGSACFFAYRHELNQGLVRIGLSLDTARRLRARLDTLFACASARPRFAHGSTVSLSPAELALLTGLTGEISLSSQLVAALSSERGIEVVMALIADRARAEREIEATLKVASRAALLVVKSRRDAKENDLWRERTAAASEDFARERQSNVERTQLKSALASLTGLARRRRFQGFGDAAAKLAGFEAWALAVEEGDALTWKASFGLKPLPSLNTSSALRRCFERGVTLVQAARRPNAVMSLSKALASPAEGNQAMSPASGGAAHENANDIADSTRHARVYAQDYLEDGLIRERGYAGYVAVAFERGALMLAGSKPPNAAALRRLEEFAAAAQPLVSTWLLEEEVERYRGLMQKLGMRLLNAADLERARIARDLHDDQAQLVATLKLALRAPKARARELLAEIERDLRARIVALRPVPLRGSSLIRAVERELERLRAAGVRGKLISTVAERALAKPIREACFQVVCEALANVARHSTASQVVVTLARRDNALRIEVVNDGVNPQRGLRAKGVGLTSLNERLGLLGGCCRLTVGRRKSTLVAEIPCIGR